ncbi:MAG: nucleoside deaminase [Polyangiaceae bacterium]|nr:nucleoside deaminase [Polyangiaceae bacterium]
MVPEAACVVWRVPEWIAHEIDLTSPRLDDTAKMRLAVDLAARNVAHGGGPFGAAIVDAESGRVVSVGANWVVGQRSSLLHAEVAAIVFAQARIGSHTFAGGSYELVTSSEPCAQCLGAALWSGVRRIVCGASVRDAEAIGFDEGPRRDDWVAQLESRGVGVSLGVLQPEARAVLVAYRDGGGVIYNPFAPKSG